MGLFLANFEVKTERTMLSYKLISDISVENEYQTERRAFNIKH